MPRMDCGGKNVFENICQNLLKIGSTLERGFPRLRGHEKCEGTHERNLLRSSDLQTLKKY